MIKTDTISGNVLRITVPDKLKTDDFRQIAPQVDSIISRYEKVRLLIDASGFNGWENIAAFENHAVFVKRPPAEGRSHRSHCRTRLAALVDRRGQNFPASGGKSLR